MYIVTLYPPNSPKEVYRTEDVENGDNQIAFSYKSKTVVFCGAYKYERKGEEN